MALIAITREVSPRLNECELTWHTRQRIDLARAIAQHREYQACLAGCGVRVVSLPAAPDLPDSVFVEDPALVLDEVAVILNMGAPSRRPEAPLLAKTLAAYRPIQYLRAPAMADGGDLLRIGRLLLAGLSRRTNREAISQLQKILAPYGYEVRPVAVKKCLHLKSACSYLGGESLLVNRDWIDPQPLRQFELFDVPAKEPDASNVLSIKGTILMPASFPETRRLLEDRGLRVRAIDLSELQKAEAGVTCCSLILRS